VIALHVALVFSQFQAAVGVVDVTVAICKYLATAPATCGAAIEVPVSPAYVFKVELYFGQLDTMV
jgi:hypothetical protein